MPPVVHRSLAFALSVCLLVLLAGAAPATEPAGPGAGWSEEALLLEDVASRGFDPADRDPWEPMNRGFFTMNRGLDYVLIDPVTRGYQFLVPAPGRRAIERVFLNLDTPVVLANEILQLRLLDASTTVGRFLINTTAGWGGILDPAADVGLLRTEADFGQTLARYGTPSGPYLVLPVFGPSTSRDALGDVVDILADPITYLVGPYPWGTMLLGGSEGLVVRESKADELEALEEGSVDFYSALRSAYLQSRDASVRQVRGEQAVAGLVTIDLD